MTLKILLLTGQMLALHDLNPSACEYHRQYVINHYQIIDAKCIEEREA